LKNKRLRLELKKLTQLR